MATCLMPHVPAHQEDFPIDSLPVTQQYHGRDHKAKLDSLRQSPSQAWPTICVMQYSDGRCQLFDGYHRISVAAERGEHTIKAHVHNQEG